MDLITTNLLAEFSEEFEVGNLAEDDRFELLASYITVKRHYTETFSPSDIVLGNDVQGIDAVAAIVNGVLITDPDALEEMVAAGADYLEVTFVFVQAKRSHSYEASQMGNFGYSVEQFFTPNSAISKTPALGSAIKIMQGVYSRSSKFKVARYQLLLAFRLLANPAPMPKFNSNKIEAYCKPIRKLLGDMEKAGDVFGKAALIIDSVAGSKFDRDNIHTLTFTDNVIRLCKELTDANA